MPQICILCNQALDNETLLDEDSGRSAHIHCFFDKQQWLECGVNGDNFIRSNPLNGKWYIYNQDNEYKHNRKPISYCPYCGKLLSEHKQ